MPTTVVSDNFKSFKQNETEACFKEINVTWKPILEKQSWWGNFHKRLIAILKSAFRKIVGQAELNFGELHTVLIQVKNMISHLIYGRNINRRNIVNDNGDIVTLDKTLIKTRVKHVTVVTNYFWN